MSTERNKKAVFLEPDVHAAVKILSAIEKKSMQDIVNDAIRERCNVPALSAMADRRVERDEDEGEGV